MNQVIANQARRRKAQAVKRGATIICPCGTSVEVSPGARVRCPSGCGAILFLETDRRYAADYVPVADFPEVYEHAELPYLVRVW